MKIYNLKGGPIFGGLTVRKDGQELLISGMAVHIGKLNQKRQKKHQIHHLGSQSSRT